MCLSPPGGGCTVRFRSRRLRAAPVGPTPSGHSPLKSEEPGMARVLGHTQWAQRALFWMITTCPERIFCKVLTVSSKYVSGQSSLL